MHLYQVTTVFETLYDHEGVPVQWYVMDRDQPVIPYWTSIKDYISDGSFKLQEDAVDELFTAEEAKELQQYLNEVFKTAVTTTAEVELPITKEMQSLRSQVYQRGEGLIVLLSHLPKDHLDIKPPVIPIAGYYRQQNVRGQRDNYIENVR